MTASATDELYYDPWHADLNADPYPGLLIFEDPPIHDIHRNLLARAFTPRKINVLEPMIRDFTQKCLDSVVGCGRFDFVKDLGAVMPLRVVSMLFGIPEDYLTFGVGAHYCLGNALARIEGRIALDEIMNRFPDWEVDLDNAVFSSSSAVRGWDSMPAGV